MPRKSAEQCPAPLSPDDLGEKGEAKFYDLCTEVGLIANKGHRDRAGWDFIVQQPAAPKPGDRLDGRTCLWTSYVQVKSTWKGKGRAPKVRLTLSAAEKLAKQLEPAFVAVLAFNRDDLSDFDFYLVEMAGESLATILKALREAERSGAVAINRVHTYLTPKAADRIRMPSGAAIRTRLSEAHESGGEPYAVQKANQLKTIGFEGASLQGRITLHDIELPEVLDVLLGSKSWTASLSHMVETRFGIDLPFSAAGTDLGKVKFGPHPRGDASLAIEAKGLRRPLIFSGKFYHVAVPGPVALAWKSKFEFELFDIHRTQTAYRLTTKPGAADECCSLRIWMDFHRLLHAMASGPVRCTLRSPEFGSALRWEFRPAGAEQMPQDTEERLRVYSALSEIASETGCDFSRLSAEDVRINQSQILTARGCGLKKGEPVRISLPSVHQGKDAYDRSPRRFLYTGLLDISGHRIAFASSIILTPTDVAGEDIWVSSSLKPVAIQAIGFEEEEFADFVDGAKRKSRLDEVLLGGEPNDFYTRALGEISAF